MTTNSIESQEAEIPMLAVHSLSAANRFTIQSGATVVLVRDGKLIRIEPMSRLAKRYSGRCPRSRRFWSEPSRFDLRSARNERLDTSGKSSIKY